MLALDHDFELAQAMTIGGHHAHAIVVPLEQRAVQVQSGLVRRNRKVRRRNQRRQRHDIERCDLRFGIWHGQRRKLFARHAVQREATR